MPALESLLKSNDLSIEMAPMIKGQIARLKRGPGKKAQGDEASESEPNESRRSVGEPAAGTFGKNAAGDDRPFEEH